MANLPEILNTERRLRQSVGVGCIDRFSWLEISIETMVVSAPEGLLGRGETFHIETREIVLDQVSYRLGIAHIRNTSGETEFQFKSLTADHMVV